MPKTNQITDVLRLADRRLKSTTADDPYGVCSTVRRALTALAPVHTCYVGFYRDDHTLLIPYEFTDGAERGGDVSLFGPKGLSHWIRASGRTYRFAQDDGRLCRAGVPSVDGVNIEDAVVVPIFNPLTDAVVGLLAVEATRPRVFGDDFVRAAEWLARAAAMHIDLGQRGPYRDLYAGFPGLDSSAVTSPLEILQRATQLLDEIAAAVQALDLPESVAELMADQEQLEQHCRRAATDLSMMVLRLADDATPDRSRRIAQLSGREREIAGLIAHESLTNAAIAKRLSISEKTVKTHVGGILRKLGLRQRAELTWVLEGRDPAE